VGRAGNLYRVHGTRDWEGVGSPREGEKFPGEIETHVISVTDTG